MVQYMRRSAMVTTSRRAGTAGRRHAHGHAPRATIRPCSPAWQARTGRGHGAGTSQGARTSELAQAQPWSALFQQPAARSIEQVPDPRVKLLLSCPVGGAEPVLEAGLVNDLDRDVPGQAVVAARSELSHGQSGHSPIYARMRGTYSVM